MVSEGPPPDKPQTGAVDAGALLGKATGVAAVRAPEEPVAGKANKEKAASTAATRTVIVRHPRENARKRPR